MIFDKEIYAVQRKYISKWLDDRPGCNLCEQVSPIVEATRCPVIVVVEFIMEIKGRTDELVALQDMLMKFYGVTEVI